MKQKNTNLLQVGKFSAVGIVNTVIDFTVLNVLNVLLGFPRIPSNIASTTLAMAFSFFVNKRLVFKSAGKNYVRQMALFLLFTAFGLYVLQNGTIYTLTVLWTAPLELVLKIVKGLGFGDVLSREFVFTNSAKAVATGVSLVWNFYWYKKVVFADVKSRRKSY